MQPRNFFYELICLLLLSHIVPWRRWIFLDLAPTQILTDGNRGIMLPLLTRYLKSPLRTADHCMATIPPPTSYLPPIAKIATCTSAQLLDALTYLKLLYNPEVRGSRRIRAASAHFPGYPASEIKSCRSGDSTMQLIRSDTFERSYSIRWLTTLISEMDNLCSLLRDAETAPTSSLPTPVHPEILIQRAASLLAICAGTSAAGVVQRNFSFQSNAAGTIEIQLTDIPLDNGNYHSLGSQTWGGACVLAEMIVDHPEQFGFSGVGAREHGYLGECGLRILELGAGTGLVGLTVAKLFAASSVRATIVMTDFYPPVLANIAANIERNMACIPAELRGIDDAVVTVVAHSLDWSNFAAMSSVPQVFSEPFDIVLGADIVYEAEHATWIKGCLKCLLRHPESRHIGTSGIFHLVVPLRPTHDFESSTVETVFGWIDKINEYETSEPVILSKEVLFCEAHGDVELERGGVVEYAYYRIGWSSCK